MNGIFISYRREDTEGFARSLFQSLVARFGKEQVFMDVEGIELGLDFVEALDKSLGACGVLLVLIGKDWVTGVDAAGRRRLDNAEDFVRLEVAKALARNIRVIPILVRDALMPDPQDLPDDLKTLTRRQALELRHEHWDSDVGVLNAALEKALGLVPKRIGPEAGAVEGEVKPVAAPRTRVWPVPRWSRWVLGLAAAAVVLAYLNDVYQPSYEAPPPESWSEPIPAAPAPQPEPFPVPETPVAPETAAWTAPGSPPAASTPELAPWLAPTTPLPAPTPAPSAVPEVTTDMVTEAQDLLARLGYEPGPVDGQIGGRTIRAVQAFQRDQGLAMTGWITDELLDALYEAADRQQGVSTPLPPDPSWLPNLSGIWVDANGIRYNIAQQGMQVGFQAFDFYGTLVAMGEGWVNGRQVDYVMVGADGTQWRGQGTLSEDGRQMQYQSVNMLTGMQETGWLQRE